jgi:hypothetical protein
MINEKAQCGKQQYTIFLRTCMFGMQIDFRIEYLFRSLISFYRNTYLYIPLFPVCHLRYRHNTFV